MELGFLSFRTVISDKLGSKYMTYLSRPSSRQTKSTTLLVGIAFLQGSFRTSIQDRSNNVTKKDLMILGNLLQNTETYDTLGLSNFKI